jgi:hypothetical protein
MKELIGLAWSNAEAHIQHAVLSRFGVQTAYTVNRRLIRDADLLALSSEREQLMHPGGPCWPVSTSHPPLPWLRLNDAADWSRETWVQVFTSHFEALQEAIRVRQQQLSSPN